MEEMRSSSQRKQGRRVSLKTALLQYFRSTRSHKKNKNNDNVLKRAHTIARVINDINVISHSTREDDEMVRMKILVRDEGMEQVLKLIRNHITGTTTTTNNNNNNTKKNNYSDDADDNNDNGVDDYDEVSKRLSIEERLNLLRKMHRRQNSWSPALQTIPEEVFA